MDLDVPLLEVSLRTLERKSEALADTLFASLLGERPELEALFPADLEAHKRRFLIGLSTLIGSLRRPEKLEACLDELSGRHAAAGVRPEHYALFRRALLSALREVTGPAWSPELAAAWGCAYDAVRDAMLERDGDVPPRPRRWAALKTP